ncbi:Uncharacterised protein [Mycobacteroides abscessus]|nr:Uncharacterised protein [Mycobacteroides abscessus]
MRRRSVPTARPMANAIWSPVQAPRAATRSTRTRLGSPVACAETASVMTTDSLGTGGKNPSIVAKPNRAG